MLISKKDLLVMTGISYGQLYRWKRSGLIPDEWFIKQSSYTGQETFFPREQILSRVRSIQELKDRYSLDELARMFSPEVSQRTYAEQDVLKITEIQADVFQLFCQELNKKDFCYVELVLMVIISDLKVSFDLDSEKLRLLVQGMRGEISSIKSTDLIVALIGAKEELYMVFYPEQTKFYMDERLEMITEIRMDEIASSVKLQYQDELNLM